MTATISSVVGTSDYRGGALREDLANFISNISRDETPFLSSIGTSKASLPRHEWQTDTLATPGTNKQTEAFEFNTDDNSDITTTRISNYTQIFGKTVHVAGSLLKSDPAGAANWFAYAMKKRGREMKRDVEFQALRYDDFSTTDIAQLVYDSTDGGSGDAAGRNFGSVFAYTDNWVRAASATVELNDSAGTGSALTTTAGTGFNVTDASNRNHGAKVVQYTASPTDVQLTSSHITSLLETMYDNGGRPNAAQIPSNLKGRTSEVFIAGNGGAAQRRAEAMSKKVNLAVDAVMAEFGFEISLIPNYIMAQGTTDADSSSSILIYDTDMVKKAVLTGMTVQEDGAGRYGKGAIMFEECTMEVRNPNSLGAIIGVKATA